MRSGCASDGYLRSSVVDRIEYYQLGILYASNIVQRDAMLDDER
jgi:hypothetical protein